MTDARLSAETLRRMEAYAEAAADSQAPTPMDVLDFLSDHHRETIHFHADEAADTVTLLASSGMLIIPRDLWETLVLLFRAFRPEIYIEGEA